MRSVGIKVLKNRLSQYIDLVRKGEVVLITDRDEVVAELRLPSHLSAERASPWVAFLEENGRRGALSLAKRTRSSLDKIPNNTKMNVQILLDELRADRFE